MNMGSTRLYMFGLFLLVTLALGHGADDRKHYIVYMGQLSHPNSESVITANHELLASLLESYNGAKEAAIHHYTKSFRGFSAMLTPNQAMTISENEDVVSVFESRMNQLHTTKSWRFLGVDTILQYNNLPMDIKSDVIIGVIDSGVWPESESFNDYGLGPMPMKFKGECVAGQNFTQSNCNRKIIGARYYLKGFEAKRGRLENFNRTFFRSARDTDGHGSHTASTIAGSKVSNASVYGLASGTATGGVPSARLSIYKACWFGGCDNADLLAALDDAIHDGVDVISMSLGPAGQRIYFEDAISIGSFHAFQKGIVVCASAGNRFSPGTTTNGAPWILTVGASTIDREFPTNMLLGNMKQLKGFSINPTPDQGKQYPLISGSLAAAFGIPSRIASFCKRNTMDSNLIKGKIVVCTQESLVDDRNEKEIAIIEGGGVGMILVDPLLGKDVLFQSIIQSVLIGLEEAQELQSYMNTEINTTARIYPTVTDVGIKPAPVMAIFSSKGPNRITPDIIKPDITAPGVNILAAWSPLRTEGTAGNSLDYNIISGTSMSCPHVSAVAALLKSVHPNWSPAMIKSAIMTTATITDNTGNLIRTENSTNATPFDYGSGHIDPVAAINPGLIYDFNTNDLINYLCSSGASLPQLKNLTTTPVCKNPPTAAYNFNYPSIGITNLTGNLSVYRTVTYIGEGPTVYYSKLEITGVKASVYPNVMRFGNSGENMTYRIDFEAYESSNGRFEFGSLTWANDLHMVRSPIAVSVVSV
ncbi:hypothetical protein L2E82_28654 [Cichorium intybus]|uniref:Uncharacterized protein n=1 Tax=Cichorium intybus TaxID=13427 RepID=A0ACB9CWE0_CICIN|nr:hypothetical protein L2E82_28654 [Cichorium intybus]